MTRHLTLVGHRKDGKTKVAVQCAWCDPPKWISLEDAWRAFTGAKVSHGICTDCAKQFTDEETSP